MGTFFFYCILPVTFLTIAFVIVASTTAMAATAKTAYIRTIFCEVAAAPIRAGLSFIAIAVILIPLWLVFGIFSALAGAAFAIKNQDMFSFMSGVSIVGGVLFVVGVSIVTVGSLIVGWGPIVLSILHMLNLRGGAKVKPNEMESREPSNRERERDVTELIAIQTRTNIPLHVPRDLRVIVSPLVRGWVVGSTMFLTQGALKSKHLPALLAHLLYFHNSPDGRIIMALRRLVVSPMYAISRGIFFMAPGNPIFAIKETGEGRPGGLVIWLLGALTALSGGGLGLILTGNSWQKHWIEAIFRADLYAARLGYGQALIAYLEEHEWVNLFDIAVPFLKLPTNFVELRIDRLITFQKQSGVRIGTQPLHSQPHLVTQ